MAPTTKRKRFEDALLAARPALLKRAQRHDRMAFALSGHSPQAAEDLVQQAMLTMLDHSRWEEVENPGAWALGVVDGIAMNWGRRAENRTRTWDSCDIEARIEEVREQNCENLDIVDRMIQDEETAGQIRVIMDAMEVAGLTRPEHYIMLARLRDVEYEQIAKDLGLGRETCVTYYSNALGKIRRTLRGIIDTEKEIEND